MIQRVSKRFFVLGALLALALSVLVPLSMPKAKSAPVGQGYFVPSTMGGAPMHWLGAQTDPRDASKIVWCIEMGPMPIGQGATVSINNLEGAGPMTNYGGNGTDLQNIAQIAYILDKYEKVDTADSRAAISMIMHFNLEIHKDSPVSKAEIYRTWDWLKANRPSVIDLIVKYVREAERSAVASYQSIGHTGDNMITGNVHGIGVKNKSGAFIAGVPFTAKLNGPAVFSASGRNTISGKTATKPITLDWRATDNGKVAGKVDFDLAHTVQRLTGPPGRQRMVGNADPSVKTIPGGSWRTAGG